MGKFTALLIGLAVVCGIVGLFSLSFISSSTYFSLGYSNDTLASLEKMESLNNHTQSLQNNISKLGNTNNNGADILGALFGTGFNIAKTFLSSFTLTSSFASSSIDNLALGGSTATVKTMITIILTVFIFVGIILAIILNRNDL